MSDYIDDNLKGVITDLEGGTAFDRSFETTIGDTQSRLAGITVPNDLSLMRDSFQNSVSQIPDRIAASTGRITDFALHVADHFNNITDRISVFASSQRLENAMAGSAENSCSGMHDHFGSITKDGPSLVGQIGQALTTATATITELNSVYTELKSQVLSAKSGLVSQLQAQLAQETDLTKRQPLIDAQASLAAFSEAKRDVRDQLTSTALSLLSGARKTAAQSYQDAMQVRDNAAETQASALNSAFADIDAKSTDAKAMADAEEAKAQQAVQRLTTLGSASSIRSLFKGDACVQTLMGYVGTDSFLGKLG